MGSFEQALSLYDLVEIFKVVIEVKQWSDGLQTLLNHPSTKKHFNHLRPGEKLILIQKAIIDPVFNTLNIEEMKSLAARLLTQTPYVKFAVL